MRAAFALVSVLVTATALAGCLGPGTVPERLLAGLPSIPGVPGLAPAAPRFGVPVVVDAELGGTEPSLVVDPGGRILVAAPTGLSPTADGADHKFSGQFWRSTDGGQSFQHLEGLGVGGLYGPSVGGGDSDIASDAQGGLYAIDLWLGNVGLLTSQDHGDSWLRGSPATFAAAGDDRQWIDVDQRNGEVYIAANALSSGLWVVKSTDQGLTFAQQTLAVPHAARGGCICPPGVLAVDEATGSVYLPYYVNPNGVGLAVSTDGGASFATFAVPGTESAKLPDEDHGEAGGSFAVAAHDAAGNVYLAWESALGEGRRVMLQVSQDQGRHWTAPLALHGMTSGTQMFPALAAGAPGRVAVAWYEQVGDRWDVRLAYSEDALRPAPAFALATLNVQPVLKGGYDRSVLGDFFELAVGPDGALHAAWNEQGEHGARIVHAGQLGGPRLLDAAPPAGAAPPAALPLPALPVPGA
jgi:hypothetical protein